ncbi:MAG: FAD-dependent oxidoreductase [Erythrobacter sp.]|nr:FAD-dependent oxidoreductase [Erythrobacter sp.]
MKKVLLIAAGAALIAAYVFFDLGSILSLDGLKAVAGDIDAFYARNPVITIAAFFAIYVLVIAASLPGAAIMSLAAGALFGLVLGTVIVSFAATIGATLAFLIARYLLRDWVEAHFAKRLKSINDGLAHDGPFYLFTLRMIPLIPFFVVNLAMGITRIETWTFVWISQIGMLMATIVFVNAGTQLATIESVAGLLSPSIIGAFILLALLPWFAKLVVNWIKRRKVYAGFNRPKRFDRNMIVIGAGSAGLVAAYIAVLVKAKVTLVEAGAMGGDCLNTGCIPSKTLIKSAKVAATMRNADRYGIKPVEPEVAFRETMARVMDVIKTIEPHDSVERFENHGVDVVKGYATLKDPWTVEIARNEGGTQRLTARSIVLATGAEPIVPDIPGIETSGYLTSETIWDEFAKRDRVPRRIAILGGGPIGCELSQALARLGSDVTVVQRGPRLIEREDTEVSELARTVLEDAGVTVLTGHEANRIDNGALVAKSEGGEVQIPYDALIVAVGRKARLKGYGLEQIGVQTDRTITTDPYLATKFPNIYACGDAAGPYQYTHAASHQAWYACVNALARPFTRFKADYRVLPAVTFMDPEFARVGLNEKEAVEQGIAYEITRYDLDDLDRAIAESEVTGFVKVLTVPGKDTILGVTIVASHAGELLAEFVLAMKTKTGLNTVLGTVHSYPTWAEANKYVAGQWKQANTPDRLLAVAERYFRWRRG